MRVPGCVKNFLIEIKAIYTDFIFLSFARCADLKSNEMLCSLCKPVYTTATLKILILVLVIGWIKNENLVHKLQCPPEFRGIQVS